MELAGKPSTTLSGVVLSAQLTLLACKSGRVAGNQIISGECGTPSLGISIVRYDEKMSRVVQISPLRLYTRFLERKSPWQHIV
ncbi:glutathione S-transferase U17-like [Gossypium australe]|uniref:Glutathione S-transferase U17-like n=1 Tax=Gossypium australe TaxID=47621 RepID=A0A5B6VWB6_9ROSI|nr:glutathione S-transferase U17-like [Gossypium australe]